MRILIPYDGSEQADEAVAYAKSHYDSAEVVLLYVLDFVEAGYDVPPEASVPGYWEEWYEQAEENGRELLAAVAETFEGEVETDVVLGSPSRAIVEYVEDHDIHAVVMGSHGRDGLSRILLGSVAESVVRRSPVPVTVVR